MAAMFVVSPFTKWHCALHTASRVSSYIASSCDVCILQLLNIEHTRIIARRGGASANGFISLSLCLMCFELLFVQFFFASKPTRGNVKCGKRAASPPTRPIQTAPNHSTTAVQFLPNSQIQFCELWGSKSEQKNVNDPAIDSNGKLLSSFMRFFNEGSLHPCTNGKRDEERHCFIDNCFFNCISSTQNPQLTQKQFFSAHTHTHTRRARFLFLPPPHTRQQMRTMTSHNYNVTHNDTIDAKLLCPFALLFSLYFPLWHVHYAAMPTRRSL